VGELRPQRYKDPRPAAQFQRFHEWIRAHRPGWIYELVRMVMTPIACFVYRGRSIAAENVPADGPFILAPNHFSNMDHFFTGVFIRRKIQFMAKSQLYGQNPVLDYIFRVGGVFPVRRGHHDEEAFETAFAILGRGGCVGMYAEGGRSRSGQLGEPKPGIGRLALESGVPVVPVAIQGSQGVRGWKRLRFPKVTLHYGAPMHFAQVREPTREQQLEAATEIFDRVREMYVQLEQLGRRGVSEAVRDAVSASPGRTQTR
jgi:1-acyl-sn-glycerol-3-phosphate acyltransferase